MKRREFVKTSAVLGFAAFSGIPFESKSQTKEENMKFSKYKGFNLTQKLAVVDQEENLKKRILKLWLSWDLTLQEFQCHTGIGQNRKIG